MSKSYHYSPPSIPLIHYFLSILFVINLFNVIEINLLSNYFVLSQVLKLKDNISVFK